MVLLDELMEEHKKNKRRKPSTEIGRVIQTTPFFVLEINGQAYSSQNFTIYVPAIDRIKQWKPIKAVTPDEINGTATVNIGDLEIEPDTYQRLFLVGDLIDVTDRGDSLVVHGRLVKL